MNIFFLLRSLLIYAVCLPLAVFLGYNLATPDSLQSLEIVGLVIFALAIPIMLRWHYPILIFSWNASMVIFFMPGKTKLWMLMAVISFTLTILTYILNKSNRLQNVPALTWSLLSMGGLVLMTAIFRGGIGIRAFAGASYGGANYYYIFFAIMGYFAISMVKIPREKVQLYVSLFVISGMAVAMSNIVYFAGSNFYWLYLLFPLEYATGQITADQSGDSLSRLSGVALAMVSLFSFMIMRYGLRGLFDSRHPFRIMILFLSIALSLLGGFRSILISMVLLFAVQFYLEKMFSFKNVFLILGGALLCFIVILPISSKLPESIQRTISFLPVDVDPNVSINAKASTEWRVKMWKALVPDIPKYLILGKGYSINPTELYLVTEAQKRGFVEDYEGSLLAGDYHSGPLSLLITFGIPGVIAFLVFSCLSMRVLYKNYRYGDPEFKSINTFIFASFVARFIFYWAIFGAVAGDMPIFAGLVGLSIAINGGVKEPVSEWDSINEKTAEVVSQKRRSMAEVT